MNVVQNYLVSIMHGNFSLYETRLFTKIVLQANTVIKGRRASSLMGKAISADGINANMAIPISDIISDGSHDYESVIDAAKKLQDKTIEFYDRKTQKWTYYRDHLINNVRYTEGSGVIRFTVSMWLLEYILDFINGNFSMYDFQSALRLPSAYAVRLYWLTCSMTAPVNYPLQMLRDMLGVGEKYSQNRDFIKRCIAKPCNLLEQYRLNGFTFRKGTGRGKKASLIFSPVKRQTQSSAQLVAQASISAWVKPSVRNYLLTAAYFDNKELSSNKDTLFQFCRLPDCEDRIVKIVHRSREKRAGKGYIINAMKSSIRDYEKLSKAANKIGKPNE